MDLVAWMGRLLFFLLVLWLALGNTATVPLYLGTSIYWDKVPLLFVILGSFVCGVVAGSLALVPRLVRLRRQPALPAPAGSTVPPELVLTRAARQGGAAGDLELETRGRS